MNFEEPHNLPAQTEISYESAEIPASVTGYVEATETLRSSINRLTAESRFFKTYDSYLGNLPTDSMMGIYRQTVGQERSVELDLAEKRAQLASLTAKLRPDYIPSPGGGKSYVYDEDPVPQDKVRKLLEQQFSTMDDEAVLRRLRESAKNPETALVELENEELKANKTSPRERQSYIENVGTHAAACGLALGALIDPRPNISIAVRALRLARRTGARPERWGQQIQSAISRLNSEQRTHFAEFDAYLAQS